MSNEIIPFTHLHTHSPEGSLLDGFMRIDGAIEKAKSWGMDSLGISDHGTMAAHLKFYNKCKEANIHPVLGMEAYITPNKTFKKIDFESIDFIEDKDGNKSFKFLSQEEIDSEVEHWEIIEDIKPKKIANQLISQAKDTFLIDEIKKTLPNKELPEKKTQITRLQNVLIKTELQNNRFLCVKANADKRNFFEWFPKIGHLLLIAKNNEGYQNMLKLNAIGQLEGFYGKPRIDFDDIKKHGKGIVATTACLGSMTSQLIKRNRLVEAKKEILRLVDCFDEVYLEIQPSRQEDQWVVNKQLIEWSKELSLPLIATSDVHMLSRDELFIHEALTNIGKGGSNDSSKQDSDISVYDSAYFMHPQEFLDNGIPQEALQNAYDLSHSCKVDFLEDTKTKFPEYEVPNGYDFDSYLAKISREGLFDLFMKKDYIKDFEKYEKRLEYELGIIAKKGLSAYFVIVWDYVNWAHQQGIFVGPGRGSGSGSLVLISLGVTNMDPIKYNLLFERMLNPERDSLPDIDMDFDYLRRHEVIDYITEKYGADHVAQIGTYTTLSTKSVLKDMARVLEIDHTEINELNKHIPMHQGKVMDLEEAIETIPQIQEAQKKYPKLFELATEVQSMPRAAGVHPCGLQISPVPLNENIPLMRNKENDAVTQYEGSPLEEIGYVKFDILGIKNLSVIRIATDLIEKRHGRYIDINNIEPDDPEVFEMIKKGQTQGIFQLESVALLAK